MGEASAEFQVSTGRMPLARQDAQALRKPPQCTDKQVRQLAAYVHRTLAAAAEAAGQDAGAAELRDALACQQESAQALAEAMLTGPRVALHHVRGRHVGAAPNGRR